MKVGLLNACTPQDEIDFDAKEIDQFRAFFALADDATLIDLIEYRITEGDRPTDPFECDAFLITGSPKGVYDEDEWIAWLADFVRQVYAAGGRLVGVCFGHQMLAHALGGRAEKSDKGWGMGAREFKLYEQQPWMEEAGSSSCLYFCHQDQVLELPPDAQLLGGNEFCPNALFVIGDQVLGIQGHPEFPRSTMMRAANYFEGTLDAEFIRGVRQTLDSPRDSAAVSNWVVSFLQNTTPQTHP